MLMRQGWLDGEGDFFDAVRVTADVRNGDESRLSAYGIRGRFLTY